MQDVIIVFNSGSSSLKFTVYDTADSQKATVLLKGEIEQSPAGARLHAKHHEGVALPSEDWSETGLDIFDHLFRWMEQFSGKGRVVAVGHRIVHGGADFLEPVKITAEVLHKLDQLTPFDPLHQQATLLLQKPLRKSGQIFCRSPVLTPHFTAPFPEWPGFCLFLADMRRRGWCAMVFTVFLTAISPSV